MHIERGSTWNRWDFHVHTPYSVLNNGFGFTPDPDWKSDCVEFDEYVRTLFTKAVENGIVAIGITDYFSIDGYKRIKEAYLSNPEKMAELFPNEELRDAIERIYVFPNIELRLDTFVGDDNHSVNYHVIFSGDIECSFIEDGFLKRLYIMHHTGTQLPISRAFDNAKETVNIMKSLIPYKRLLISQDGYFVPLEDQYFRVNKTNFGFMYGGKIHCVGLVTNIISGWNNNGKTNPLSNLHHLVNESFKGLLTIKSDVLIIQPLALYYESD